MDFWDTRTGRPRAPRAAGPVPEALRFSPDGRTLAGATSTGIQLWDVASGQPLGGPLPIDGSQVEFTPSGDALRVLWGGGIAAALPVAPRLVRAAVCARAGGGPTRDEWRAYVPELPYRVSCP